MFAHFRDGEEEAEDLWDHAGLAGCWRSGGGGGTHFLCKLSASLPTTPTPTGQASCSLSTAPLHHRVSLSPQSPQEPPDSWLERRGTRGKEKHRRPQWGWRRKQIQLTGLMVEACLRPRKSCTLDSAFPGSREPASNVGWEGVCRSLSFFFLFQIFYLFI